MSKKLGFIKGSTISDDYQEVLHFSDNGGQ